LNSGTKDQPSGNFILMGDTQMIRINKLILLFLFNVTFIFAQDKLSPLGMELKSSEERISTLVNTIEDNLSGTSVLELFRNEQKIWQEYLNSRIETLFPHYVNGVKMQWGSILSHELARITLQMNLERIKILEDFLYVKNETGTDGKGEFKEDFWAITLSLPTTAETPVVAPAEAKVVVADPPPAAAEENAPVTGAMPLWAWFAIGGGALAVAGGVFAVRRKR